MFDTNKKKQLSIRDQLRMAGVVRWQIVATDRKQNVAEHTCNVMLIACEIMKRCGIEPGSWDSNIDWSKMMVAVLYHDLPEVVMGDVPTPLKMALGPEAKKNFDEIEASFSPGIPELNSVESAILKAADMIDALQFLHKYGVGTHASNVSHDLEGRLRHLLVPVSGPLRQACIDVYNDALRGDETFMEDLV